MARKGTLTYDLEQMKIGEKRNYPSERCQSVASLASTLSFRWGRKYTSKKDKKRGIITVTRIK